MGAGKAVKRQAEELMQSRVVAEAIQQAVAADRRLREVRYGQFAEEGAVGQEYLPIGTGGNLLHVRQAEFGAFSLGSVFDTAVNPAEADSVVVDIDDNHRLFTTAATNPFSQHRIFKDQFTNTHWHMHGPTDNWYMFSTYAYQYIAGQTNYVALRIDAADDQAGTNEVNVYDTATDTTADYTLLDGDVGELVRLHAKFYLPPGKRWIRITHKLLYNATAGAGVSWGNNMLEMVNEARTYPSKYVAPAPKAGELSMELMSFGNKPNILPYQKATLAEWYVFPEEFRNIAGVDQGWISASSMGVGYYMRTKADGVNYYTPSVSMLANTTDRWVAGKDYIISCDVENILPTRDIDVRMRAREATSAANIDASTGLTLMDGAEPAKTFRVPVGQKKRLYIVVRPAAGPTYGPRVEFRGTVIDGAGTGGFFDFTVSNFKMEEVDLTIQTEPSPFTLPTLGEGDLRPSQIATTPILDVEKTTTSIIGAGNNQQPTFNVTNRSNAFTVNSPANTFTVNRTGYYLIGGMFQTEAKPASDTNAHKIQLTLVRNGSAAGTNIIVEHIVPQPGAVGGFITMWGWIPQFLERMDVVGLRVANNSASQRDITWTRFAIIWVSKT